MSAGLILIALELGQPQPEPGATDAEKKAFFALLAALPTRGEFFADEGVARAVPSTRVLLALTEADLKDRDLYPFLALSAGLASHKEAREVALNRFDRIAHPVLKLSWAVLLFRQPNPPRRTITFLNKALDSPADADTLAGMMGPDFGAFQRSVHDAHDESRGNVIELVKTHRVEALPQFAPGGDYESTSLVLSPSGSLHAVRPLDDRGELIAHDWQAGTWKVRPIPQPPGVRAGVPGTFGSPLVLARNARGDLLCRWTIGGNGDHGLGLLKVGADTFLVKRSRRILDSVVLVDDQEGGWLIVVGGPRFQVLRVDADLGLTTLGSFAGAGQHSTDVLDARMIAPGVLHCFWGDVVEGNHLRMRCVDFDLGRKTWLHDRVIRRVDEFVGSANRPRIIQLADRSLHYVWRVDPGASRKEFGGTYWHSESHGATVKVADGVEFTAVACGHRLVVCSSDVAAPNRVSFRVIHNGTVHAPTEITIDENRKYGLFLHHMALAADGDRVWFVNTLKTGIILELRLGDRTEKKRPG